MRKVNQVQAMGDNDAAEEVVSEEVVTKNVVEEADAKTAQHTHNLISKFKGEVEDFGAVLGNTSEKI